MYYTKNTSGFIIHKTNSRVNNCCAAVTYRPDSKETLAFVHGLTINKVEKVTQRLENLSDFHPFPTLIPMILLEFRLDIITGNSASVLNDIYEIERYTGLNPKWELNGRISKLGHERNSEIDFVGTMLDLTAIAARLGHYIFMCRVSIKLPDMFNQINADFLRRSSESDRDSLEKLEVLMRAKSCYMKENMKGMFVLIEEYSSRVQAQCNTVCTIPTRVSTVKVSEFLGLRFCRAKG
jgi:hypothetical protein